MVCVIVFSNQWLIAINPFVATLIAELFSHHIFYGPIKLFNDADF